MTLPVIAAALYAVFLWWFGTGAILWLDRRPRGTYRTSLLLGGGVALACIFGLVATSRDASPVGAILSFSCALGVWGFHELAFLTGAIAGPRKDVCPPGARGWRRFKLAASTLIHHEIALALTAGALLAATWNTPNQIGAFTFLILFAARLSAKLNLFLGVPNFTDEFFPEHLRYLTSYLRKSPASALFPISLAVGGALAVTMGWSAFQPGAGAFAAVGGGLLVVLTTLALIEHAFMVVPLPDAALWRWMLPASAKGENG